MGYKSHTTTVLLSAWVTLQCFSVRAVGKVKPSPGYVAFCAAHFSEERKSKSLHGCGVVVGGCVGSGVDGNFVGAIEGVAVGAEEGDALSVTVGDVVGVAVVGAAVGLRVGVEVGDEVFVAVGAGENVGALVRSTDDRVYPHSLGSVARVSSSFCAKTSYGSHVSGIHHGPTFRSSPASSQNESEVTLRFVPPLSTHFASVSSISSAL